MNKFIIIKDSIWNMSDYSFSILIFLVTSKLLIKYIGIDGYGFYSFFISLIGSFGLTDLGMGMVVTKFLSEFLHKRKYKNANQVITLAFIFYLSVGIVLFLVVLFFNKTIINFLDFSSKYTELGMKILLITTIVFTINMFTSVMLNTLIALEKWKNIAFLNISFKVLNALLLSLILMHKARIDNKLYMIFISLLLTAMIKFIIYLFTVKITYKKIKVSLPNKQIKKKVFNFIKISSCQYGLSLFSGHLDKVIISKLFGLEILGIYTFAVNVFTFLYNFLANLFKVFLPKLSKLHGAKEYTSLKILFNKLLIYSLSISIVMSCTVILFWKPIISCYMNVSFAANSFFYLIFFAIYLVVRSFEPIYSYFFNSIAKPIILVHNLLINSIIVILGYFIFIPLFSIYGIILSQIIACIFIYIFNSFKIKKLGFHEFF